MAHGSYEVRLPDVALVMAQVEEKITVAQAFTKAWPRCTVRCDTTLTLDFVPLTWTIPVEYVPTTPCVACQVRTRKYVVRTRHTPKKIANGSSSAL